jgi:hypothetical protein
MYVTLYGTSDYVESLVNRSFNGKVLHDKSSVLRNTHLHAHGIERGTQPYGGYGYGASSISINGKITAKPTMPQRDIYEYVARPLLQKRPAGLIEQSKKYKHTEYKNVQKLLRMKSQETSEKDETRTDTVYLDTSGVKRSDHRYVKLEEKSVYRLLESPNAEYISELKPDDVQTIRKVPKLLKKRPSMTLDEFATQLYALSSKQGGSERGNKTRQLRFFRHLYELLLGRKSGPRLPQFLSDIEPAKIRALLDV